MSNELQVLVIDDQISGRESREVDGISFFTRPDLPAAIFTLNHFKPDLVVLSRFEEDDDKLKLLQEQAERQSLPVIKLAEDLKESTSLEPIQPQPEDLLSGKLNSLIRELLSGRALKEDWEVIKGASEEKVVQSIALLDELSVAVAILNKSGELLYTNRVTIPEIDLRLNPLLLDHVRHLAKGGLRRSQFESEDGLITVIQLSKLEYWEGQPATRVVIRREYPKSEPNHLKPHHLGWEWMLVKQDSVVQLSTGGDSLFGDAKFSLPQNLSELFVAHPEVDWTQNIDLSGVELTLQTSGLELGRFDVRELPASLFGYEGRMILLRKVVTASAKSTGLSSEDLLHITSHDLREPIRVLLNYGQLLERRLKKLEDPELSEFAGYMIESGKRMEVYLEQLKTLIRLGKQDEHDFVDLNQLVPQIEKKIRSAIAKDFNLDLSDNLPAIKGVPLEVDLLYYNLLSNAVKFSPPGSTVQIKSQDLGPNWLLSVVDEGKGIPEDIVDSIFEVSKRLELSGSPQGAGLGLSICKSVVDSAGGKIWIESKEGRGTTVFIAWPKPK